MYVCLRSIHIFFNINIHSISFLPINVPVWIETNYPQIIFMHFNYHIVLILNVLHFQGVQSPLSKIYFSANQVLQDTGKNILAGFKKIY